MDYVRMYEIGLQKQESQKLVSEVFTDKCQAEEFAYIFSSNYFCNAYVRETDSDGEHVVFADGVDKRLIRANYRKELACYVVANWIYTSRQK